MAGMHTALSAGVRVGEYRIESVLGIGGFGITYKAYEETLEREVALKEYLPTELASRDRDGVTVAPRSESTSHGYAFGLSRFRDEARTLARFNHPSIVAVTRFFEANQTGYLVMTYEDGESLADHLRRVDRICGGDAAALMAPLLRALAVVHANGFLHRDIKPGNVLLRRNGPPVLIDFGSARQALRSGTGELTAMLTPGYAPLEQYSSSERQSAATDLYSLGATIFRCITGAIPEAAPTRLAARYEGREDPVSAPLEMLEGRAEKTLLDIVRWMLEPSMPDRPDTAARVLRALGEPPPEQAGAPGSADPPATASIPMAEQRTERSEAITRAGSTRGRSAGAMTGEPPSGRTGTSWDPGEDTIHAIELLLGKYAGPIAKVLVAQAMKAMPRSRNDLCRRLARQLPDLESRRAFLEEARRVS